MPGVYLSAAIAWTFNGLYFFCVDSTAVMIHRKLDVLTTLYTTFFIVLYHRSREHPKFFFTDQFVSERVIRVQRIIKKKNRRKFCELNG